MKTAEGYSVRCSFLLAFWRGPLVEWRRTNELRGNKKQRERCLCRCLEQRRTREYWEGQGYLGGRNSRMSKSTDRARMIGNAGTVSVNVNRRDKTGNRDQQDAAQGDGAIRPRSGPQIRVPCHS